MQMLKTSMISKALLEQLRKCLYCLVAVTKAT